MYKSLLFVLAIAAAAAFPTRAEDVIEITSTPAEIRVAQDALKRNLGTKKGPYDHLSKDETQKILLRQETIYALIEGKHSIESLNGDEKIRLANALEEVRALVAQAEDSRLVCERVKVLGSNRPEKKCMSVGHRRQLREQIQREGIRTTN